MRKLLLCAVCVFCLVGLTGKRGLAFCWESAGEKYGISPWLLYAIAQVESGLNPKAVNTNANGSKDVGLMQINSFWFPILKKHGIDEQDLLENPCTNVMVGAWILAQNVQRHGPTWEAVGAYNARSEIKRLKYARKVADALLASFSKKTGTTLNLNVLR